MRWGVEYSPLAPRLGVLKLIGKKDGEGPVGSGKSYLLQDGSSAVCKSPNEVASQSTQYLGSYLPRSIIPTLRARDFLWET